MNNQPEEKTYYGVCGVFQNNKIRIDDEEYSIDYSTWGAGIVGVMPLFEDKELAENFACGKYPIVEFSTYK